MATLQVLMSCYNEKQYIEERLAQIVGQTRPADEVLIVDDGSTDGSYEMLQQYAEEHPSLKVFSNGTNQGNIYTARRLTGMANADYLHFAGFDDIMRPEFFEQSMMMLEVYPEAAFAYSPAGTLFPDGRCTEYRTGWSEEPTYFTGPEFAQIAKGHPVGGLPTVLKREALESVGGFPAELKWHSDGFIETMLAFRHGFCFIPDTLTINRVRDTSYSEAGRRDWQIEGPILDALLRHLKSPEFRNELPLYQQGQMFNFYGPRILWAVLGNPEHWDLESFRLIRPMLAHVLQDDQSMENFVVQGLQLALDKTATPAVR